MKSLIRNLLNTLHLDLTSNLKYDRLTKLIIKKELTELSNCIDVGCHKGEILELFIKHSPKGNHFAFEPIPSFYQSLQDKYKTKATILPYALSEAEGSASFQYVKNAPAYSGLKKRDYDNVTPEIEEINVEKKKLDDCIPVGLNIRFIKIDVEGGEFNVLKGAERILKDSKPFLLFEFGLGASDFYETNPSEFYDFLTTFGYSIYALQAYLEKKDAFSKEAFVSCHENKEEYYFIAN